MPALLIALTPEYISAYVHVVGGRTAEEVAIAVVAVCVVAVAAFGTHGAVLAAFLLETPLLLHLVALGKFGVQVGLQLPKSILETALRSYVRRIHRHM